MPFGIQGAPSSWRQYINGFLWEFLDQFTTVYVDAILIFSKSRKDYVQHVKLALERLREHGLQLDIEKCEFFAPEIKFLELLIALGSIRMDPAKVEAICSWQVLLNEKRLHTAVPYTQTSPCRPSPSVRALGRQAPAVGHRSRKLMMSKLPS